MDAATKVAHHRLSVLELAQLLGNVTEACRQKGMTRTQFYEYKRRFQTHGLEGLKDLPPIHKTHPMTTPPEEVEKVLAMSLANPAWGPNRLSDMLKLQGTSVSSFTVYGILAKHDMATKFDRLLKLEEQAAQTPIELTADQIALIEKANPCFRERHVESSRPGELLAQDTFFVGHLKGVGKVCLVGCGVGVLEVVEVVPLGRAVREARGPQAVELVVGVGGGVAPGVHRVWSSVFKVLAARQRPVSQF